MNIIIKILFVFMLVGKNSIALESLSTTEDWPAEYENSSKKKSRFFEIKLIIKND